VRLGSESYALSFLIEDRPNRCIGGADMSDRPVVSGTDARAGTREGVVRYILVASLVLVVLLFIVAYERFS
jgi:hypothetical protein